MTTYEKIKALLELNTLRGVAVKRKNGEWKVFTHICKDGSVQGMFISTSIEDSLKSRLCEGQFNEIDINYNYTSEIVPLPMKPKVLPVGTKVKILDIVKECGHYDEWEDKKKNMKHGVIETVYNDANGIAHHIDGYIFPSYCVVPDFDEEDVCTKEDTRERIVLNGKTYVLDDNQ